MPDPKKKKKKRFVPFKGRTAEWNPRGDEERAIYEKLGTGDAGLGAVAEKRKNEKPKKKRM
jgi:hypothetical protein